MTDDDLEITIRSGHRSRIGWLLYDLRTAVRAFLHG